jgi:adenylyltransferase/sulfurtransferase
MALADAGVGGLVLVDFDRVDESNLQRQVIFRTSDVGRPKVEAARDHLRRRSPRLDVTVVDEPFSADNAARLVADVDLVLDGADNFSTRYLVNDACVLGGRANVFGSVSKFEGQVAVFAAARGPCYRCLHPEPPPDGLIPSCAEGGVLGVLPGVVGALQAVEAVKILTGVGQLLVGRLLLYDALRMRLRDIALPRDPECPVCGDTPVIRQVRATAVHCTPAAPDFEITPAVLAAWRRDGVPHVLVDVREPLEHEAAAIGGDELVPRGQVMAARHKWRGGPPVIVYCRSGARSALAARELRDAGIDARSLSGGIERWTSEVGADGASGGSASR